MEITEVRVFLRNEDKLKAYVTVTFDNSFVIRNMKIIKTKEKLIVSMPSRKMANGTYKDIAHPINAETRANIEKAVIKAYEEKLKEGGGPEFNKEEIPAKDDK